jgi:outer membrane lipase/esterase
MTAHKQEKAASMKHAFFGRALPLIAFTALAFTSLPTKASVYNSMVIFGDSLSDSGNNALAVPGGPQAQTITGNDYVPSNPYAPGTTYSNGPVWATYAASALGVSAAPSLAGGTNYAFGGATTGPAASPFPYSLLTQANQYLATNTVSANALYVIAGGGNDARAVLNGLASPVATIQNYAANVGAIVDQLQTLGAQHIIVWNTPNLGLAPAVALAGGSSVGTSLATAMNLALTARLSGEAGVSIFDIFALGTAIAGSPGLYGFTDVTNACGAITTLCDTYAYWDGIHPTTAAHQQIAEAFVALASPVPEASTWAMLIVGFAGIGFVMHRRRNSAASLQAQS